MSRSNPEPLIGREHSGFKERDAAELGSHNLNAAIRRLFLKWEDKHGFQPGAAERLLPAGYALEREGARCQATEFQLPEKTALVSKIGSGA